MNEILELIKKRQKLNYKLFILVIYLGNDLYLKIRKSMYYINLKELDQMNCINSLYCSDTHRCNLHKRNIICADIDSYLESLKEETKQYIINAIEEDIIRNL
ncbi:MAG: hypothetical protein H7836_04635 [Magnetococcus sp. YQC-3]